MASPPIKAILFDIGGVVVKSPMQPIADYEAEHKIPPNWVNFAISRSSARPDGSGAWSLLEQGKIPLDDAFFSAFHKDLHDYSSWRQYCAKQAQSTQNRKTELTDGAQCAKSSPSQALAIPPLPKIDTTTLFWAMMFYSRREEPAMAAAIERLRSSGRFIIAALSNTVLFPAWHPFSRPDTDDVRSKFDVFVSSAHAKVRKPHKEAYQAALAEINRWGQEHGKDKVEARNVLFLDDIGQNLKGAKEFGLQTIKVTLSRTEDAVEELERRTGLLLRASGQIGAKL